MAKYLDEFRNNSGHDFKNVSHYKGNDEKAENEIVKKKDTVEQIEIENIADELQPRFGGISSKDIFIQPDGAKLDKSITAIREKREKADNRTNKSKKAENASSGNNQLKRRKKNLSHKL